MKRAYQYATLPRVLDDVGARFGDGESEISRGGRIEPEHAGELGCLPARFAGAGRIVHTDQALLRRTE
jgi:hypothetical protein